MHDADTLRDSPSILLTSEGYKALREELEHLTQQKRPEIANRIRESLQHGEFSEDNSELDEVKFEQAIVENRIAELKNIFGSASVLDPDKIPTDYVGLGSKVKVKDLEFGDDFEVRLVASIEANPDHDLISIESPFGSSLLGRSQGDKVEVLAPSGIKSYEILSIGR